MFNTVYVLIRVTDCVSYADVCKWSDKPNGYTSEGLALQAMNKIADKTGVRVKKMQFRRPDEYVKCNAVLVG
jgi:hypothetical protein